VRTLLSDGSGIVVCLHRCYLAVAVSVVPLFLFYSSCQAPCHNIHDMRISVELSTGDCTKLYSENLNLKDLIEDRMILMWVLNRLCHVGPSDCMNDFFLTSDCAAQNYLIK
jgi:hypothetical protein